ncbi:MAG: RDD family protein [Candidatus Woesearchaeota archaeon]|nr:RDD family protein [Candidatus Woesearchaeota archaeon]
MNYKKLLTPRTGTIKHNASFLRRFVAFIIDILILDLFITIPFTPVFAQLLSRVETTGFLALTYTNKELGAMIVLFLIVYTYFVLFEYLLGQTIGMMLLSIRVQSSNLWRHAVRNCYFIPAFPFVLFWVIEPLSILFMRRGILEQLSNTRTLYERKVLI